MGISGHFWPRRARKAETLPETTQKPLTAPRASQQKALAFELRATTAPPQPTFARAPIVRATRASVVQPQLLPAGEGHVVRTEDA